MIMYSDPVTWPGMFNVRCSTHQILLGLALTSANSPTPVSFYSRHTGFLAVPGTQQAHCCLRAFAHAAPPAWKALPLIFPWLFPQFYPGLSPPHLVYFLVLLSCFSFLPGTCVYLTRFVYLGVFLLPHWNISSITAGVLVFCSCSYPPNT